MSFRELERGLRDRLARAGTQSADPFVFESDDVREIDFSRSPLVLLGAGSVIAQPFVAYALRNFKVAALIDTRLAGTEIGGMEVAGAGVLRDILTRYPSAVGVMCCQSDEAVDYFLGCWGDAPHPVMSLFQAARRTPHSYYPDFAAPDEIGACLDKGLSAIADPVGRTVLCSVLLHRLSWEYKWLAAVRLPCADMYFHTDALAVDRDEILVDGGAYDCDTIRSFLRATGGAYRHIHAFEADPGNFPRLQAGSRGIADLTLHAQGLWSGGGVARFHSGGLGGSLDQEGEVEVSLVALDDLDLGPVSFIKADIEGAEVPALRGARHTIERHKPKLAICAYHKPDDIVTIIDAIQDIRDDYRFTLRHHSPFYRDTVIYAE